MKVEFTELEIASMRNALDKWGPDAQCDQTVEECAELIVALHKQVKRSPKPHSLDDVIDEMADVEMMLAQMRPAFDISDESQNTVESRSLLCRRNHRRRLALRRGRMLYGLLKLSATGLAGLIMRETLRNTVSPQ
jgi:NTP pyrophosphatase (non-canonical NTP hydrolase)